MALRRTHLVQAEDKFTLDYGLAEDGTEQKLNVIWNPRKYTPALEARVESEQKTAFQSGVLPTFLAELLIDWDMMDFVYEDVLGEDGEPTGEKVQIFNEDGTPKEQKIGVTYDEIAAQPLEVLMDVLEGCVGRVRPKKRSSLH